MNILHVTAHLGGGVGKAHAGLTAAMRFPARQSFLLLEEPRDRRYVDEIAALGRPVDIATGLEDVAARAAEADIVQIEFWNHPKIFECLARTDFPDMRAVFWCHVSGLFRPVIQPGFLEVANRFVFTSPASLEVAAVRAFQHREKLAVIGGAYGFEDAAPPSFLPDISRAKGENGQTRPPPEHLRLVAGNNGPDEGAASALHPLSPPLGEMPGRADGGIATSKNAICYLGTVDFAKMHPGFFEAIDALTAPATTAIWGAAAPEVAARGAAMRHPYRIRFMGQTPDPRAALGQSRIFFYPLQPDHYGTGENALVEAMSLGLVPVVLANPAECAIIQQGQTGFIASSISECRQILDMLLADLERVAEVGARAREVAATAFTADRSARQFINLWSGLMQAPKRLPDFRSVTGGTPRQWFEATQFLPGEVRDAVADTGKLSKGTLSHFKAAFPDDPCWD
jgi:glycosyltransferase involved in cell wall biosynthesis